MTTENFGNSGFFQLLPAGVGFAATAIGSGQPLHAGELDLLSPKAKEFRRQTLQAGRDAVRKALNSIGIKFDGPILRGLRGEPLFPEQVVGSLSHSGGWSVAAVTRDSNVMGLGIDIQILVPGDRSNLGQRIASAVELQWLVNSSQKFLQLFSMKEAVYKALAPSLQRFIGFREVEIFPTEDVTTFVLDPAASDIDAFLTKRKIELRSQVFGEYLFSVAIVSAS